MLFNISINNQFAQPFQLTTDKCKTLLVQAFCNILMKCKDKFRIVMLPDPEVGKEVLEEETLDDYDKDQVGVSSEDAKMHVGDDVCIKMT